MTTMIASRPLLGLALRRDRIMIPIWLYALVASVLSTVWSYRSLYPTAADRRRFALSVESNGATRAIYGRVYAPDSLGGLSAWRLLATGGALLVVFAVLLVIRHSRAEEEAGRVELLGAAVVGRAAPLAAAVIAALTGVLAVAAVVAVGMIVMGLPAAGALAFGASWLGLGTVFVAVGAVGAQLTQTARTARGIALAVAAACFLLRVIADASVSWLTWATPFGWAEQVRPFGGDRWWALILPMAASAILLAGAFRIHARRDLGAGLLPQRPGPARAGRLLSSATGLTVRLGRGSLLSWLVGMCVYGLVIGAIASSVDAFTNGSNSTADLLTKLGGRGGLVDAFLGASLGMAALAIAAYGVTALVRARDEEVSARLEAVLATRVGRLRWLGSHVGFALGGSAVLLLVTGLSTGVVHGLRPNRTGGQLGHVVSAMAVQIAAVWLVIALGAALLGCLPRASQAAWALVGICAATTLLGPVMNAPQAIVDISPFTHLSANPSAAVPAAAIVWSLGLGAAAIAVALAGFRHRDIGSARRSRRRTGPSGSGQRNGPTTAAARSSRPIRRTPQCPWRSVPRGQDRHRLREGAAPTQPTGGTRLHRARSVRGR
jgi:ABC-2 type transport system permease protein